MPGRELVPKPESGSKAMKTLAAIVADDARMAVTALTATVMCNEDAGCFIAEWNGCLLLLL